MLSIKGRPDPQWFWIRSAACCLSPSANTSPILSRTAWVSGTPVLCFLLSEGHMVLEDRPRYAFRFPRLGAVWVPTYASAAWARSPERVEPVLDAKESICTRIRSGRVIFTRFALPDSFDRSTSASAQIPPANSLFPWWCSMGCGAGTDSPSNNNPSTWHSIASTALLNASSAVSPAEKQPGKSGTVTPYAEDLSLWMTTGNFMVLRVANPNRPDGRHSSAFPSENPFWDVELSPVRRRRGVCIDGANHGHSPISSLRLSVCR